MGWAATTLLVLLALVGIGAFCLGFVRVVSGSTINGGRVCDKSTWGIAGTFVDLDSYGDDPGLNPPQRLTITLDLIACGVLAGAGLPKAP